MLGLEFRQWQSRIRVGVLARLAGVQRHPYGRRGRAAARRVREGRAEDESGVGGVVSGYSYHGGRMTEGPQPR